ncbi:hypothetical protein DFJ73DRAFT_807206 [Zopfochytrium polystomum]|nr:hypothetical protein DFJ73DRAFT_807206 [Zopfochytrium polystomum]
MAPWPYRTVATVLLSPDFYRPFFLSTLICVAWYTTIIRLTRSTITSTRQKAWVLTLLSSLVMIIVGSRMTLDFILLPTNATIADLPSLDSPLAWALSAFFLAYLAVDVVIGTRFYPDQFGFISGWVHHLGYAYCVFSLLQRAQIGSFLAFGAILELSTVPLALGHIDKRMRRDWVFGGLFFVTRVVFHAYVVYHAISVYHRSWYWIVPTLPWPLHVHWFLQWVKQQRRLKKKQLATSTSTAVAAAVPVQRSKKDE